MYHVTQATPASQNVATQLRMADIDEIPDVLRPELPPRLREAGGKTTEEVIADLKKHPFFMTELDPDSDEVAALTALAYEGTTLEMATNFKEHGNECFREKRFGDAKEFYAKGISILDAEERRRRCAGIAADPRNDCPEEVPAQKNLLELLCVNHAACQLELRNYGSCLLDCAAALQLNPANVKAFYRSARALLSLGRLDEADEACVRGLAVDDANAPLGQLAAAVVKARASAAAQQRRDDARLERDRHQRLLLCVALKARQIRYRQTGKAPDIEDARVRLLPDPGDPRSALSFPVFLYYPAHLRNDFIKSFDERESLEQHFGYVFPLPWDLEGVYKCAGVECYMETVARGLVKVGKKVPLLQVLSGGKVEIVDEMVKIYVLPKREAAAWVADRKRTLAGTIEHL